MLIALLRRAAQGLTTARFEDVQQESLLKHIAETELQADMLEMVSQGKDEKVPELRAMAAALRQKAGLPLPERLRPQTPTGLGGLPLRPPRAAAPAPAPPFPLEETYDAGRKMVEGSLANWTTYQPDFRPDVLETARAALEKLDLAPFLVVYEAGAPPTTLQAPTQAWDEGLGRLAHLDAQVVPPAVLPALAEGVQKLVAVRGEIKRRAKAAAAPPAA